eukprot:TRINITY_DN14150_c0_g1_i1.p1 TRINITY_DN14150_c0_g1~~TRINITY_DN14150_c0_g1_i1.p1  ORF type:complete len:690 (+),score=172.31 TRINITY_DN14150_c0_g1_i1:36-2105(+)
MASLASCYHGDVIRCSKTVPSTLRTGRVSVNRVSRPGGELGRQLAAAVTTSLAAFGARRSSCKHRAWSSQGRCSQGRCSLRASLTEEEQRLWRRAYELEVERAALLHGDESNGLLAEAAEPPEGWKAAFQRLRDKNAATTELQRYEDNSTSSSDVQEGGSSSSSSSSTEQHSKSVSAVADRVPDSQDIGENDPLKALSEALDYEGEEPMPKVFSVFNLPPSEEISEDVMEDALDVVAKSDFPALAAFFGIAANGTEEVVPDVEEVRRRLGLEDPETKALFQVDSVRDYGSRVCCFCGRLTESAHDPGGQARLLLGQLKKRLEGTSEKVPGNDLPELDVFLQPCREESGQVQLFVFLRSDLPEMTPSQVEEQELIARNFGIIVTTLCVTQAFVVTNPEQEVDMALSWQTIADQLEIVLPIWPFAPLLLATLSVGLLAREGVAQSQGVKATQIPIPSVTVGHLGSIMFPHGFFPSRQACFDTAVAAPLASLLASAALVTSAQAVVAGEAPLHIPAVQLPASLAAYLGYAIPAQSGETLVTLASPTLDVLNGGVAMPMVPVDAFLLAGSMGLTISAANLLPVPGFDGHWMVRSAFGSRAAGLLEVASLWGLCLEVGRDDIRGSFAAEIMLVWMVQWLLGRRVDEVMPAQDEVTEPGLERQALAALLLASSAAVLLPAEAWDAFQALSRPAEL